MKKNITIIEISQNTKQVWSVYETEKNYSEFESALIDCDLDSIIIESEKEKNLDLQKIEHAFTFENLIPVVTRDLDGKILMQAFVNEEALRKTFETKFGHYFSRSRNSLWFKGETSGNTQSIKSIFYDAKRKFLVYEVVQNLAACHEGYYSCYFRKIEKGELVQIDSEKKFDSEKIYNK
jgi:phosphoribosyl-AMP cyclohydrolase